MSADANDWSEDWRYDAAADTRHDAERAYRESDRYIADSLQWVADHGHEDSRVVAVAGVAYAESDQFSTFIDDLLDNEVTL